MYDFRFIKNLTLDSEGNNIGPVPIASFIRDREPTVSFSYNKDVIELSELTSTLVAGVDLTFDLGLTNSITDYSSLLLGHGSKKLQAELPAGEYYVIDIKSHTPFLDYEVNATHIFIDPEVLETKVIGYRETDATTLHLFLWEARYDYTIASEAFTIAELESGVAFATLDINPNPLELYATQVNSADPYCFYFKKTAFIWNDQVSEIQNGATRHNLIADDAPVFITDKLLKLSHKGLITTSADLSATLTGYTVNGIKVYCDTPGLTINSIDAERGLILLNEPAPSTIRFTYSLNNTDWFYIKDLHLSPLHGLVPETVTFKFEPVQQKLYFSVNGSRTYFAADGVAIDGSFSSILDLLDPIITVTITKAKYEALDIRQEGGLEIGSTDKSFTTHGFMGIEPKQLNVVLIKVPDLLLTTLITQFEIIGEAAYGGATLAEQITYIQDYTSVVDGESINLIEQEVMRTVARYIPLGVLSVVIASDNTVIF